MSELLPARKLSKAIFNRESRLTTWHAVMSRSIDPPEPFRAKDIFDQLYPNANAGQVGEELKALVEVGAIARMPELDAPPSKYYRRLDGLMWPLIQELAERTIELSAAAETEK